MGRGNSFMKTGNASLDSIGMELSKEMEFMFGKRDKFTMAHFIMG